MNTIDYFRELRDISLAMFGRFFLQDINQEVTKYYGFIYKKVE